MALNTEFYITVCHEGLYTEAMLETGKLLRVTLKGCTDSYDKVKTAQKRIK